jgi:hypothetical protein
MSRENLKDINSLLPGIGCDCGTSNLLSGRLDNNNSISINKIRDAFLKIEKTEEAETIMKQLNVSFAEDSDFMYILGDSALEISNLLGKTAQRPMKNGIISSIDIDAIPMLETLLSKLLGKPLISNEICVYTIPAMPLNLKEDQIFNLGYHEDKLNQVIESLGFTPKATNEAVCIGYDALKDYRFSGINISFGAGQINVASMMLGIPGKTFSIVGSGDLIDSIVANQFNTTSTKITKLKEKSQIDVLKDVTSSDNKIGAICLAYKRIVNNLVANIKVQFAGSQFEDPIPIAIAGGTSLIGNFKQLFVNAIESNKLPFEVSEVIHVEDALNSVVRGSTYRSRIESSK